MRTATAIERPVVRARDAIQRGVCCKLVDHCLLRICSLNDQIVVVESYAASLNRRHRRYRL